MCLYRRASILLASSHNDIFAFTRLNLKDRHFGPLPACLPARPDRDPLLAPSLSPSLTCFFLAAFLSFLSS